MAVFPPPIFFVLHLLALQTAMLQGPVSDSPPQQAPQAASPFSSPQPAETLVPPELAAPVPQPPDPPSSLTTADGPASSPTSDMDAALLEYLNQALQAAATVPTASIGPFPPAIALPDVKPDDSLALGLSEAASVPPPGNSAGPGIYPGPPYGGLTILQRQVIYQIAVAASYTLDYFTLTFKGLAQKPYLDLRGLEVLAGELNGLLAGLGPIAGIIALFIDAGDAYLMYAAQQFASVGSQLAYIESQVLAIPEELAAAKAVQTYVEEHQKLETIDSAFAALLNGSYVDDPTIFTDFVQYCQLFDPKAYLDNLQSSLTANGSCPVPGLCLLDPYAGVASFIEWNQTAFQTYLLYFAEDALTASYLTTTCHIAEGEYNSTITALRIAVAASYQDIINNLIAYYNGPMTTVFWSTSFYPDIQAVMQKYTGNADTAQQMQGLFSSKYPFLNWGVAMWDGVTGSDYQGITNDYCATGAGVPPPASCTATGGSFFQLRYPLNDGAGQVSYAVFFSASGEAYFAPAWNETIVTAAVNCGTDPDNQDMVALATCISEAVPGNRGTLCVAFGNGLLAYSTNVFFWNFVTQPCYPTSYSGGCAHQSGVEVSVVMQPPPPPSSSNK